MQKKVDNYTYNTADIIGYGATSIVYLGSSLSTNETVAIRVISLGNLTPETKTNLKNQMSVLNYLPPHPNIVKVHCILQTQNHVYVVTEYCDSKFQVSDNYDVTKIARGILEALKHLVKNNVVHRDLKPENIMLSKGVPKLIDFGFARRLSNINDVMFEYLGTPYYMAPQILQYKFYTSKSDIWSLGVLLYQILFKVLPYTSQTTDNLIRKIKTSSPQISSGYNDVIAMLIKGCLIVDQKQRYSWEDVFTIAGQLDKNGTKQNRKQMPSPIRARTRSLKQAVGQPNGGLIPHHNVFTGYGY